MPNGVPRVALTIEKQRLLHLCLAPDGKFNLGDDPWLESFRARTGGAWEKLPSTANQLVNLNKPSNSPDISARGWTRIADELQYRPRAFRHHDSITCSVALATSACSGSWQRQAANIVDRLNGDEFFPASQSADELGVAWCVELSCAGPEDFDAFRELAYAVAGTLFATAPEELKSRDVLDAVGVPLPFGWFAKVALRKHTSRIAGFSPAYITVVDLHCETSRNRSSDFGERFLDQLILPEVKALALQQKHPVLRAEIVDLSERLESHSYDVLASLSETGQPNPASQSKRTSRDSVALMAKLFLPLSRAINNFKRHAVTLRRNAQNVDLVVSEASDQLDLTEAQTERFRRTVTNDIRRISDQFQADEEWMDLETPAVELAGKVQEVRKEIEATETKRKEVVAGLWLAMIGIILAVIGVPSWFPDELPMWSWELRTSVVGVVIVTSIVLYAAGGVALLRAHRPAREK